MRKIHVLKAIVDLVWILTCLLIPFIIICIPLLFIYDIGDLNISISNINLSTLTNFGKTLISISLISYLMLIYSLFLFRKVLGYFLRLKIFDFYVIKTFQKIGILLSISGLISLAISIISNLYFNQKFKLEIGMNEHIIMICLGLFFMILSEIFKIGKISKEENDLTV